MFDADTFHALTSLCDKIRSAETKFSQKDMVFTAARVTNQESETSDQQNFSTSQFLLPDLKDGIHQSQLEGNITCSFV